MIINGNTKIFSEPSYLKNLSEYGQIIFILFSPYEASQDVLLVAFKEKILVGHLDLSVRENVSYCLFFMIINFKDNGIDITFLSEFPHPSRCTALSISPETLLTVKPSILTFCSAGSDFAIRVYNGDLADNNVCKVSFFLFNLMYVFNQF